MERRAGIPSIDLADETYIGAAPPDLAAALTDPSLLRGWFPDLEFQVFMARGVKGTRWSVQGELDGSVEVWLEPMGTAGTLVHWFVRGEPAGSARGASRRYVQILNARMFSFKDRAERASPQP